MPLFSRKNKQDALISRIAEEVAKATNAMASTPMGGSGYATTTAAQPAPMSGGQGLLQTPGNQANPLPRPSTSFGSQLGPAAPFLPAPLDPVLDESGRALPRVWEYPVAWNLDLNQRTTPWSVLRSMADQIDIIHRAIEIKIAELTKLDWSFTVEDATIAQIMAEQNASHAQAARIAREKYDSAITQLREFWENPYPQLGRTFSEWLTEFLWQHFVFDGTPVYPRYNLGKNCIGFEIIDAPTIKVLLDNRGAVPEPPAPAFQQVLWGFPRGEYQATESSDGEFYAGAGKYNEFLRDQLAYFVKNRRTWSPYGYSCVEQSVPAATLYLERQRWMKAEYQYGTIPMAFFETDSDEMDIQRLSQFDKFFNDHLTGQTAERMRTRVLPRGFKPVFAPTVDERYKSDYDNFLILRIATIFGVAPSQLGVIPRSGLGGAGEREGEAQSAVTQSQKPLESFLTEVINTLSRRFLGADKNITFSFDDTDDNPAVMSEKAKAYQVTLNSGQMTMNDVRGELGMPLYDFPEADEPFIVSGSTIQFLRGAMTEEAPTSDDNPLGTVQDDAGKESQSQEIKDGDKGETSQGDVAKAELASFNAFVKKRQRSGKWRDFEFTTISADKAAAMNASGRALVERGDNTKGLSTKRQLHELPGIEKRLQIEAHYAPLIAQAIAESVTGVDAAISQALSSMTKAGQTELSVGRVAVAQNIKINDAKIKEIFVKMRTDAGHVGVVTATQQIGDKTISHEFAQTAMNVDWKNWKPGDPLASAFYGRHGNSIGNVANDVAGIGRTNRNRIATIIANGLSEGQGSRSIAAQIIDANIKAFLNDEARAMTIAITETNMAYNLAATDTYAASGIEQWTWLAYDDNMTCEECDARDGEVYDVSDTDVPPEHPSCRCTVQAVISTD